MKSRLVPINCQTSNLLFSSAYVLLIEAHDENGNPGISQAARARLVITVEDVNDMPPLFKQRKYEGFMSSDLSRLRNNLQVEAVDLDKTGTVNSDVRYEIIIIITIIIIIIIIIISGTRSSLATTSRSSALTRTAASSPWWSLCRASVTGGHSGRWRRLIPSSHFRSGHWSNMLWLAIVSSLNEFIKVFLVLKLNVGSYIEVPL